MGTRIKEPISLREASLEWGMAKSKLNYYAWLRLIKPVTVMGKTMIFEKDKLYRRLLEIERKQEAGIKLQDLIK